MRNKLSRREDRALLRALREVVLTQYPNPERNGCPGTAVLEAIATKRISMLDPAHEHVGSCSPCFKELTDLQRTLHRRNALLWAVATAGAALVVFAVLFPYFGFNRRDIPHERQNVQTARPSDTQPTAHTGEAIPSPEPVAPAATPKPQYETALLDLRNSSASRTVGRGGPDSNTKGVEIPRALLALTVQLPFGSDAGSYEVEIRESNEQAIQSINGEAAIENGITNLFLKIDTRSLRPGEYAFAWRHVDFSWRQYPILIR